MSLADRLPHSARRSVRRICLGLIAMLYVISVPWYQKAGAPLQIWMGLPDWVAIALLCYVGVAVLNGIAWWLAEIPEEGLEEAQAGEGVPEESRHVEGVPS